MTSVTGCRRVRGMSKSSSDILRAKIKKVGVAKVARAAGVSATTLYSFCSDDLDNRTEHLRSDTRKKVLDALTALGVEGEDDSLQQIVNIWDHIPDSRRRLLAQTAREMAEGTTGKKSGD